MSSTLAVFEGIDASNKEGVWVTDGSAVGTSELVSGSSPSYSACHGTGGCLSGERGSGGACFIAMLVRFVNGVGVDGIG